MSKVRIRASSTLTRKGQVTIPAEIRKALGLEIGDRVDFELEDDRLIVSPQESAVLRTAGIFKEYAKNLGERPLTAEQLREVATDAWVEDAMERLNRQ